MTDEAKLPKPPKRWLAFGMNLTLFPTGYVYAGAPKVAVAVVIGLFVLMASVLAWTLLYPPGPYALSIFRGEDAYLGKALLQLGLLGLVAAHAAIIAKPRKLLGLKAWVLATGLWLGVMGAAWGWRALGPYSTYDIPWSIMAPTLQGGDIILARGAQGACNTPDLKAGQIVLSREHRITLIRRAVAGPGQTVQMAGGRLWIDGAPLKTEPAGSGSEGRLVRETLPNGEAYLTVDLGPSPLDDVAATKVPAGHWYLLGDNRDNSVDSRVDGPVAGSISRLRAPSLLKGGDGRWIVAFAET